MKNLNEVNYEQKFKTMMIEKSPIYNKNGQQLILEPDEYFCQCYDSNKPGRNELPPYWFLSNKGNLISLAEKEPRWLSDDAERRDGYGRFQFQKADGTRKSVEASTLKGLVYGGYIFGKAKENLEKYGLDSLGKNATDKNLQKSHTHHILGKEHQNVEDLEIVTEKVHRLLHKNPDTEEKIIAFMEEFSSLMKDEAPEQTVVLFDGRYTDLKTDTQNEDGRREIRDDVQILFSENGLRSLLELLSNVPVKIDVTE